MLSKPRRLHLGAICPQRLVVILAGSVVAAGAASASRAFRRTNPAASSGRSSPPSTAATPAWALCVSSDTGTFTLVGHIRQGIVTVDVATTTTYTDAALTPPTSATFADVCVGDQVKRLRHSLLRGAGRDRRHDRAGPGPGIVTSVNGVPTRGHLRHQPSPGNFTLAARHHDIVTVDVTTATDLHRRRPHPATSASFANVCVGSQVKVLGTLSSGALAATSVDDRAGPGPRDGHLRERRVPPRARCGVDRAPRAASRWSVRHHDRRRTVDVTRRRPSRTPLSRPTSASFANVCVGSRVTALGTLSSGALAATLVTIVPAQAQGTVTSVTVGATTSTTAGSCGTGGLRGQLHAGWLLGPSGGHRIPAASHDR